MKVRTNVKAGGILSQHNESLVRPGALRAGAGQPDVRLSTRRTRAACFAVAGLAGLTLGLASTTTALPATLAVMTHECMHPPF